MRAQFIELTVPMRYLCLKARVIADRLDDILAIVEYATNGDIENIRILQGKHLRSLEMAHLPLRRQHEHADAALAAHGVFRTRTRVPGCRAKDIQALARFCQRIFEQVAQAIAWRYP